MVEEIELNDVISDKQSKRKRFEVSKKCRRIVKYVILILCVSGLIFQATQLTIQYLARRTIVQIDFETIWYNRLPAITICYPNLIAMNKTVEKFPQLNTSYNEYKNILKQVSERDFRDYKVQKRLNDLYEAKFYNFTKQMNLSFEEWSEISIPYEYPGNSSRFAPEISGGAIEVMISGLRRFENGSIHKATVKDKKPIQSYVMNYADEMTKCFTFFSHLQKKMQSYQMDTKRIFMTVIFHLFYPPDNYIFNDQ